MTSLADERTRALAEIERFLANVPYTIDRRALAERVGEHARVTGPDGRERPLADLIRKAAEDERSPTFVSATQVAHTLGEAWPAGPDAPHAPTAERAGPRASVGSRDASDED